MAKLAPKTFYETVGGTESPNSFLKITDGGHNHDEIIVFMVVGGATVGDIWLSKDDAHALCVDLMERLVAWDD